MSQPLRKDLPGAWGLGQGEAERTSAGGDPELLLLGKITKKTRRVQDSSCGKGAPGAPGRLLHRAGAFSGASDPQRGPGAKVPPLFFFKAKLSFYLDKLFKKCK